jgi:hypothetical protein
VFDLSASIAEAHQFHIRFLELFGTQTATQENELSADYLLILTSIQRQFLAVTTVWQEAMSRLRIRWSGDHEPSNGTHDDSSTTLSINPEEYLNTSQFLSYGGFVLTLSFQVWAANLPNKKTYKRKKINSGDENMQHLIETIEKSLLENFVFLRAHLSTFMKNFHFSLNEMKSTFTTSMNAAKVISPSSMFAYLNPNNPFTSILEQQVIFETSTLPDIVLKANDKHNWKAEMEALDIYLRQSYMQQFSQLLQAINSLEKSVQY